MLNFILKSERVGLTVLDDLTWNYPGVKWSGDWEGERRVGRVKGDWKRS